MSVKTIITTPEGQYLAVLGHWFPKLLGADDTVIGGTAYFRLGWYADGSLASPSPGHLAHAWTHVGQQRRAGLTTGGFKAIRTALWWWKNHTVAEAEADLAAEENRQNPVYLYAWNQLRTLVRKWLSLA